MTGDLRNPRGQLTPATYGLLVLAALGILARIVLWQISFGTNDVKLWGSVGQGVAENGLRWAYVHKVDCNQPPLQPLLAAAAHCLAAATGTAFVTWFKLPMLLADCVTLRLIWRIVLPRRGTAAAAAAMALFSWSLVAILISAHHGNADSLCAMLALAGVWLLEDKRRPFLGGLVLGAAINLKLIPVLLVPPMFAACRSRREFDSLLGGLALMAIPSAIMLLLEPDAFRARVLEYQARWHAWGFMYFLIELRTLPEYSASAELWLVAFNQYGKYLIIGVVLALSVVALLKQRGDRYEMAALTLCAFLIFAAGFGYQYAIYPTALLVIVWPAGGAVYSLTCGLYLLSAYSLRWDGTLPIATFFAAKHELLPGRTFGLFAWACLVVCSAATFRRAFMVKDGFHSAKRFTAAA